MQKVSYHLPYASILSFSFFKFRSTLLNHPKSSCFCSVFAVFCLLTNLFSKMALIYIFHIDIQITYSKEQCNYIGEVLPWSSSNE